MSINVFKKIYTSYFMPENQKGKNVCVSNDMVALIEEIQHLFEEEYGFRPTILDVTRIIAQRVKKNKLF